MIWKILHRELKNGLMEPPEIFHVAREVIKSPLVSTGSAPLALFILFTLRMPVGVEMVICPEVSCCAILLGSPLRDTLGSWPAAASCDMLKFELCGCEELGAMAMGTWVVWMVGAGEELCSLPFFFSPGPSPPPALSLGPLTNTPPDPLCRFRACLCRDSYKYFYNIKKKWSHLIHSMHYILLQHNHVNEIKISILDHQGYS